MADSVSMVCMPGGMSEVGKNPPKRIGSWYQAKKVDIGKPMCYYLFDNVNRTSKTGSQRFSNCEEGDCFQ